MSSQTELRRREVLRAIVADYVSSQEPVGSKALVERHNLGVSSATIRNDMAVLEAEGFITQEHASSGRIPTEKGYRLFVDSISKVKPLSKAEHRAILEFLEGGVDLEDVLRRSVQLLSQLTRQVAVVQLPTLQTSQVRHCEVVQLANVRLLVVIITDTGRVDQRTVTLRSRGSLSARHDGGFDIADVVDPLVLERLRTRLNGALAGRRAADVAPILATLAEQASADERFLLEAVSDELIAALRPDAEERLVVAGTANLARATPDFSSLGPLLDAVEEQVVLLRLFTAADGAPAGENRMRVSIGSENKDDALAEASVVTTTYGPGTGEAVAHLGVIGPTRMDYPATMTAVRAVARYLSRFLSPPET